MGGQTFQYDEHPEVWRPLTAMPQGAERWEVPGYVELAEEWAGIRAALKDRDEPRAFLDKWLEERGRAFAIETGQIEGLYTLKRGITERLIAEGLAGVVGAHTVEGVADGTIQGLLRDQETAYNMLFEEDIAGGRPLTQHAVRSWHQLVTRHQETVAGITADGRRVQVPFRSKGQWKLRPNNPRRHDGVVHEYCPPERVQDEMDRFFKLYADVAAGGFPTHVEAAWMHGEGGPPPPPAESPAMAITSSMRRTMQAASVADFMICSFTATGSTTSIADMSETIVLRASIPTDFFPSEWLWRSDASVSMGSIPAFSAIVRGMVSSDSAYFLMASCSRPSNVSAHVLSCAAMYASAEPPPATMAGRSITSRTTMRASCIDRSTSSTTRCEPPLIRIVTDCGFWQPSTNTHLSDSTFFWWTASADPRSSGWRSSMFVVTRPPVAFASFVMSLSFTRRTASIPLFAR